MTPDDQLRNEVVDALNTEPLLAGRKVDVDVRMGMVRMTGYVETSTSELRRIEPQRESWGQLGSPGE